MGLFGKKKIEGKTAEEWFAFGSREKDPKKEVEYYTKALEIDPKYADAWNNKGLVLLHQLGRYEEAIRCFDKASESRPSFEAAKRNKKFAEEKLREKKEKGEKRIEGKTAKEWFGLALKEEDPEKKIRYYSKCLELDPKNADAWYNRGLALSKSERYEAAIRDYDRALDIDPKHADAWNNKGLALGEFELGRYEEAIGCYDKALDIDPKDAITWNDKGTALHMLGRYEEAIRCYDKALDIDPKLADAWNNKGFALGELERYEEAIRCYDKALDIDPEHEKAKNNKELAEGELKEQKGKVEGKISQLYEETLNAIGNAQSRLQKAKNLGINTKWDEEKLNNAKLKVDQKDFSYATKLAKECRSGLDRKITEYKQAAERSAKQSLDFAYSKMREAEKLGINVPSANNLHKKAISKFDRREYEKAIEYSENCKKAAEDEIRRYNHAKEQIEASKGIVESVKRFVSMPKAENLMKNAEAALEIGNYNSAFKFAKQAEGEALKFKQDYERYKETSEFISSIESEISRIKKSGVKIPKSAELIKQAKSELNKNNFERAKKLANEAKRIAVERKSGYDFAFKSISEAERILKETKNKGVIIPDSTDLLTKSKQAFDSGDYKESVRLSEELKSLVNNREIKYREARDWIKTAEFAIEKAKEFGCTVSDAEERLKNTERLFEKGAYEEVIEAAKQIEELVKKIKEKAKPEITIELSKTSFKPNSWQRIDLIFKNNGTATAKDINVEYPKERVEIEGLMALEELKPQEEKPLRIGFRPLQVGEVPLKTEISCKDLDGKEYKEEKTFWITVGERIEEKRIATIEIKRGYEILQNNDLRFGIRVINNTGYAIMDVETILDYPKTLFSLKDNVVQTLANIHPNGERTAKYILTPLPWLHPQRKNWRYRLIQRVHR